MCQLPALPLHNHVSDTIKPGTLSFSSPLQQRGWDLSRPPRNPQPHAMKHHGLCLVMLFQFCCQLPQSLGCRARPSPFQRSWLELNRIFWEKWITPTANSSSPRLTRNSRLNKSLGLGTCCNLPRANQTFSTIKSPPLPPNRQFIETNAYHVAGTVVSTWYTWLHATPTGFPEVGFIIPFYRAGNGDSERLDFLGNKYLLRVLGTVLSAGDRVVNEINTVLSWGNSQLASNCGITKTRTSVGLILKHTLNPTQSSS